MTTFRFIQIALFLIIAALSTQAKALDSNDPRLLSTITLPKARTCSSDVSNDGEVLYTICDSATEKDGKTPSGPATLYVYDISDLRQPRQIAIVDLGKIQGMRLVVRNGVGFYQKIFDAGIDLIDLHDASHASIIGTIQTGFNSGFRVSEDGHMLIVKLDTGFRSTIGYKIFDVNDLQKPKEIPIDSTARILIDSPGIWREYDNGKINGLPTGALSHEVRAGRALVSSRDQNLLELYDLAPLKRLATFPADIETVIIPGQQAVVFPRSENRLYTIQIVQAVDVLFDVKRLQQVYGEIAEKYRSCSGNTKYTPDCLDIENRGLAQLKDAGVERLLDEQPAGLTAGQRVLMLNDYGFWLHKWNPATPDSLTQSARVLRKVVELAPDRTSAWLNLGDTLKASIPFALKETEKASLWTEMAQAYARYKQLSKKDAQGWSDLASYDLPAALKSSVSACEFIANAANHNQLSMVTSPSGTARVRDKIVSYVVGFEGGSCGSDAIKTPDECQGVGCKDDNASFDGLYFPSSQFGGSGMVIVPFRGKYYVVSDGLDEVIDPETGPLCSLDHHYNPSLVENKSPLVCESYLKGILKDNVKWTETKTDQIQAADVGLHGYGSFDRMTSIKVSANQSFQFGHYNVASGAGCGCNQSGLALLNGNNAQSTDEEPNKSLIDYQTKWWRCGESDAGLIQRDGKIYVDAYGPEMGDDKQRPRALLQWMGGSFQPVCRVEQVLTVTPGKPHSLSDDAQQ